jgi:phosphodiesterase/alkaline phosphatase D-like protein
MKRARLLPSLIIVVLASVTGSAQAASSPSVVTGTATGVTDTTAVLNASVDPNGSPTVYLFSYGPTSAYGIVSTTKSIGSGSKGVTVSEAITGLVPGTEYHYRVQAQSSAGVSIGVDRTFTTAGFPPPGVVTGPAAAIGATVATPTASINPNGEQTTWAVQYGLTASYGYETFPQALSPVTSPLPVSTELQGLAPETLFHYRIVAYHGDSSTVGADATFFTEPLVRPKPQLTVHISPALDKRSPYTFTTSGTLGGATAIPAPQRCTGNVGIRFYNGHRELAFVVAPIAATCAFSQSASFRHDHGSGPTALRVSIDFRGNGYVAPAVRTAQVTAGS